MHSHVFRKPGASAQISLTMHHTQVHGRQRGEWSGARALHDRCTREAHACAPLAGVLTEGATDSTGKVRGVEVPAAETRDTSLPRTGGRNVARSPAALCDSIGSGTDATCASMTREDREVATLTLSSYDDDALRCASVSAWLDLILNDPSATDFRATPDSNVTEKVACHPGLSQQTATFINTWCRAPHSSNVK